MMTKLKEIYANAFQIPLKTQRNIKDTDIR